MKVDNLGIEYPYSKRVVIDGQVIDLNYKELNMFDAATSLGLNPENPAGSFTTAAGFHSDSPLKTYLVSMREKGFAEKLIFYPKELELQFGMSQKNVSYMICDLRRRGVIVATSHRRRFQKARQGKASIGYTWTDPSIEIDWNATYNELRDRENPNVSYEDISTVLISGETAETDSDKEEFASLLELAAKKFRSMKTKTLYDFSLKEIFAHVAKRTA